jgi:hypothetical protein
MKKNYFTLLALLLFIPFGFSQIDFQKGYFISNQGEKTECLIKNLDWKNNPTEIKYRQEENSEIKTALIEDISEFLIYDESKFVRATVDIDRSSDNVNNLSTDSNPIFKKEQLFLKVLLEGNATLFQYQDSNLTRFFYSIGEVNTVQLIYKRFYPEASSLSARRNESYKEQLKSTILCGKITDNTIDRLNYEVKALIKVFMEYNSCTGSDSTLSSSTNLSNNITSTTFNQNDSKRDKFNLTPRIGVTFSSFDVKALANNANGDIDYGLNTSVRFGLETEFILPYNKNKIALIAEFTWSNYESEVIAYNSTKKVDYQSLDIPFGVRYYFFLNKSNKIFINAVYNLNASAGKDVDTKIGKLEIAKSSNFGFGLGYKFKNKLSVEYRLLSNRNASDYTFFEFNYSSNSVVFGYSFF